MDYFKFLKQYNAKLWFSVLGLGFAMVAQNMDFRLEAFDGVGSFFGAKIDAYPTPIHFLKNKNFRERSVVEERLLRNNVDFSGLEFAESDFMCEFLQGLSDATGLTAKIAAAPNKEFDYFSFKSKIVDNHLDELVRLFLQEGATKLDGAVVGYVEALENARTGHSVQPHITSQRLLALAFSLKAYFDKKTAAIDFPNLTKFLESLLAASTPDIVDAAVGGRMFFGGRVFPERGRAYGGAYLNDGYGGSAWQRNGVGGGTYSKKEDVYSSFLGGAMWNKSRKGAEYSVKEIDSLCDKFTTAYANFSNSVGNKGLKHQIAHAILGDYVYKIYSAIGVESDKKQLQQICSYANIMQTIQNCVSLSNDVKKFVANAKISHPDIDVLQTYLEPLNARFTLHRLPMQVILSVMTVLQTPISSIDVNLVDQKSQPELFQFLSEFNKNNKDNKVADNRTFLDMALAFYATITGEWFADMGGSRSAVTDLNEIKEQIKNNFASNATNMDEFEKITEDTLATLFGGGGLAFPENKIEANGAHTYKKHAFNYFDKFVTAQKNGDTLAYSLTGPTTVKSEFNGKDIKLADGQEVKFEVEAMIGNFLRGLLDGSYDFDEKIILARYKAHVDELKAILAADKKPVKSIDAEFLKLLEKKETESFIVGLVKRVKDYKMVSPDGKAVNKNAYSEWAKKIREYIENIADVKMFDFAIYDRDKKIDELLSPDLKSKGMAKLGATGASKKISDWAKEAATKLEDKRDPKILGDDGVGYDYNATIVETAANFEKESAKTAYDKLIFHNGLAYDAGKKNENGVGGKNNYNDSIYGWFRNFKGVQDVFDKRSKSPLNFKVDKMIYEFMQGMLDDVNKIDKVELEATFDRNIANLKSLAAAKKTTTKRSKRKDITHYDYYYPNLDDGYIEKIAKAKPLIIKFLLTLNDFNKGETDGNSAYAPLLTAIQNMFADFNSSTSDVDKQDQLSFITVDPADVKLSLARNSSLAAKDLTEKPSLDGATTLTVKDWIKGDASLKDDRFVMTAGINELDVKATITNANAAVVNSAANAVFEEVSLPKNEDEPYTLPPTATGTPKAEVKKNKFNNSIYNYFKELFKNKSALKYSNKIDNRDVLFFPVGPGEAVKTQTYNKDAAVNAEFDIMIYNFMNSLLGGVDNFDRAEIESKFVENVDLLKKIAATNKFPNLKKEFIEQLENSKEFIIDFMLPVAQFKAEQSSFKNAYEPFARAVGAQFDSLSKLSDADFKTKAPFISYLYDNNVADVKNVLNLDGVSTSTETIDVAGTIADRWKQEDNLKDERPLTEIDLFDFDNDETKKAIKTTFATESANVAFDAFEGFTKNEKVDDKTLHNYKKSVYYYFLKLANAVNLKYAADKPGRKSDFDASVDANIKKGNAVKPLVEKTFFNFMKALCVKVDNFDKASLEQVFDDYLANIDCLGVGTAETEKISRAKPLIVSLMETLNNWKMEEPDGEKLYSDWAKKVAEVIDAASEEQLKALASLTTDFKTVISSNMEKEAKFFKLGSGAAYGGEKEKLSAWFAKPFNLVDDRKLPEIEAPAPVPPPPPVPVPPPAPEPPKALPVVPKAHKDFQALAIENVKKHSAAGVFEELGVVQPDGTVKPFNKISDDVYKENIYEYFKLFAEKRKEDKNRVKLVKDINLARLYGLGDKNTKVKLAAVKDYYTLDNSGVYYYFPAVTKSPFSVDHGKVKCTLNGKTYYSNPYLDKNPDKPIVRYEKDIAGLLEDKKKLTKEVADLKKEITKMRADAAAAPDVLLGKQKELDELKLKLDKVTGDLIRPYVEVPLVTYEASNIAYVKDVKIDDKGIDHKQNARADFKVETLFYNLLTCMQESVNKVTDLQSRFSWYISMLKGLQRAKYELASDTTNAKYILKDKIPNQFIDDVFLQTLSASADFFRDLLKTLQPFIQRMQSSAKKHTDDTKDLYKGWLNSIEAVIRTASPNQLAFVEYEPKKHINELIKLDPDSDVKFSVINKTGGASAPQTFKQYVAGTVPVDDKKREVTVLELDKTKYIDAVFEQISKVKAYDKNVFADYVKKIRDDYVSKFSFTKTVDALEDVEKEAVVDLVSKGVKDEKIARTTGAKNKKKNYNAKLRSEKLSKKLDPTLEEDRKDVFLKSTNPEIVNARKKYLEGPLKEEAKKALVNEFIKPEAEQDATFKTIINNMKTSPNAAAYNDIFDKIKEVTSKYEAGDDAYKSYKTRKIDPKDTKYSAITISKEEGLYAFLRAIQIARELFYAEVPDGTKAKPVAAGAGGPAVGGPGPGAGGAAVGGPGIGGPGPGAGGAAVGGPGIGGPGPGAGGAAVGGPGVGAPVPEKKKNPNLLSDDELKRTNGEALNAFVDGIEGLKKLIQIKDKAAGKIDNPNKLGDEDKKRTVGERLTSFVDATQTLCNIFKPASKIVGGGRKEDPNRFAKDELKRTNMEKLQSFCNAVTSFKELFVLKKKSGTINKMNPLEISNGDSLTSFISAVGTLRELVKVKPAQVLDTTKPQFYRHINSKLRKVVFANSPVDLDNTNKFVDKFFGGAGGFADKLQKIDKNIFNAGSTQNKKIIGVDLNPFSEKLSVFAQETVLRALGLAPDGDTIFSKIYDVNSGKIKKGKKSVSFSRKENVTPADISTTLPLLKDNQPYTLGQMIADLTKGLPCSFANFDDPTKDVVLQHMKFEAEKESTSGVLGTFKVFESLEELQKVFDSIKTNTVELDNKAMPGAVSVSVGDFIKGTTVYGRLLSSPDWFVASAENDVAFSSGFDGLVSKRTVSKRDGIDQLRKIIDRQLNKTLQNHDERFSVRFRNRAKYNKLNEDLEAELLEKRNRLVRMMNKLRERYDELLAISDEASQTMAKRIDSLNLSAENYDRDWNDQLAEVEEQKKQLEKNPNAVYLSDLGRAGSTTIGFGRARRSLGGSGVRLSDLGKSGSSRPTSKRRSSGVRLSDLGKSGSSRPTSKRRSSGVRLSDLGKSSSGRPTSTRRSSGMKLSDL